MTKAYSLTSGNKPMLFSYDLDTEYQLIDKWVLDHKKYSKRNLDNEVRLLRQLAEDYLQIIETKRISAQHLLNIQYSIMNGPSGVWEKATSKLELLSYHFEEAQKLILSLLNSTESKTIEKAFSAVSNAFPNETLRNIITNAFAHKNKTIRAKAASVAWKLNNRNLTDILKSHLEYEKDPEVINSLHFSIAHLEEKNKM